MARKVKAVAIIGPRGKLHLDKIAPDAATAWGLLADELSPQPGTSPRIVEMRRQGFDLRKITVTIDPQ